MSDVVPLSELGEGVPGEVEVVSGPHTGVYRVYSHIAGGVWVRARTATGWSEPRILDPDLPARRVATHELDADYTPAPTSTSTPDSTPAPPPTPTHENDETTP